MFHKTGVWFLVSHFTPPCVVKHETTPHKFNKNKNLWNIFVKHSEKQNAAIEIS